MIFRHRLFDTLFYHNAYLSFMMKIMMKTMTMKMMMINDNDDDDDDNDDG